MLTTRLDRRLAILRGKRGGAFDSDQYYLEQALRARTARKTRCFLRQMQPLVLVTPRWSQARRFLDDVAVDLMLGEPAIRCRTLSLMPLEGRTPHQAWSWLVQAVTEFCGLTIRGPAWQVVSRHGFRVVMKELFRRAERTGRRCLMIHALEHIHVEALRDLLVVFEDHLHHRDGEPQFNLLLAGAIDAPHIAFDGVERLILPDFTDQEALESLVEYLGPEHLPRLRSLVAATGGIPAVLDALGTTSADRISQIVADPRAFWRSLGSLGQEIRRSYDILSADPRMQTRLEQLADAGQLPHDPERDGPLFRAGFVHHPGVCATSTTLRSPVFHDLVLSS